MKKTLAFLLTLSLLIVTLVSCSGKSGKAPGNESLGSADGYPSLGDKYENDYDDGKDIVTSIISDRKIIKTVNETLQTDDYNGLIDEINKLVKDLGGYISSANYSGDNYYNKDTLRRASITVRIPAEKLDEFTGGLEGRAVVSYYNETVDDVTGSYIDVESRIAVLESEEAALLEMLSASGDVSTMLTIRSQLTNVQSELASLRAQKKDYDSRISYSTVYINVNEVRRAISADPTFFEEIGNTFSESLYDIGFFFRSLAVGIIGNFLYIIIWAAVIVLAVFLVRRYLKKRKLKNFYLL